MGPESEDDFRISFDESRGESGRILGWLLLTGGSFTAYVFALQGCLLKLCFNLILMSKGNVALSKLTGTASVTFNLKINFYLACFSDEVLSLKLKICKSRNVRCK